MFEERHEDGSGGETRDYTILVSRTVSLTLYLTTVINDVEDRRLLSQRKRTLLLIAHSK